MCEKGEDMEKTVSDCLVEMLAAQGVERLYGLVGDSLNPVLAALRRNGRIRWISMRQSSRGLSPPLTPPYVPFMAYGGFLTFADNALQ